MTLRVSGICQEVNNFLHFGLKKWCAREDLNLQSFRNQILSLARLPFRHARAQGQDARHYAETQEHPCLSDSVGILNAKAQRGKGAKTSKSGRIIKAESSCPNDSASV